jgi:hypothetical protein
MSSSILDSPQIKRVRKATEATSDAVDDWRKKPLRLDDAEAILNQAIDLVSAWKAVVGVVDDANRNDAIEDYLGIGDTLYPYVVVSNELLQAIDRLRIELQEARATNGAADFQRAVIEMGKIAHYFENWPRSRSELIAQIREEFARGDFRPFEEFLDEMQARGHAAR